ncbi:major facilitator superfamily domain-containing protein [Chiua virens]|nr:major facilitator superfamily domain-containing protein [Chiua virens]
MSPVPPPSPPATLVEEPLKRLSFARKLTLLLMFCFAQFLDSFNNSALFPAIPALENSMGITQSQSAWIISAFQLTFASFLLIVCPIVFSLATLSNSRWKSGRISDVYNPKITFISGVFSLGILSVGAGFVDNKIVIIMLRSFMGIAAAMTIPSALTLLVRVFPDPLEQARAIGMFGGCGATANVLGLFIGAVLDQYASYHWVFWFVAIIAIPVATACIFIIPPEIAKSKDESVTGGAKWKSLDLIGISILTVALILFIYAVTSGSTDGWTTAGVLAPLIISILLTVGFFYWETRIPIDKAAIPPRTWFYSNFTVLFAMALLPFFWWSAIFVVFTTLWQDVFGWTAISTAIHMFPIGVVAIAISFTGALSRVFSPKWIILTGVSLGRDRHCSDGSWWRAGAMMIYTHTNIAIFQAAPASMAGTVGAIFNGALEFGSAIGIAAFTSIETSVETIHGGPDGYYGRATAFWFLLALVCLEILSMAYFYRRGTDHGPQPTLDGYGNDNNDAARGSVEKTTESDDVKNDAVTKMEELNKSPV